MKTIDVRPEDLEQVLAILDRHVPGREVRAFGSRVAGKAKAFSDLDLAVLGADPLSARDSFRRIIEQEFVVVREEGVSAHPAWLIYGGSPGPRALRK